MVMKLLIYALNGNSFNHREKWASLTILLDLYMHLCIQESPKVECIDSPEMTSQVGKHGRVARYWKFAQLMRLNTAQ